MNKFKKTSAVITAMLISMTCLSGCEKKEDNANNSVQSSSSSQIFTDSLSDSEKEKLIEDYSSCFDETELDTSLKNPSAEISLKGDTAEISGEGVKFADKKISITSGGTYIFSGTLDDGQIYVNTKEKVHIGLNGVNISCSNSSPIFIEDSDNAVITVCNGTENTLSDTANYIYKTEGENEPDAVIYSKDDLAVNGTGTLNLTANYNEGLASKNDLRISGVILNVTSVGNAVKGKDSIAVRDAVITADSKSDGLKSPNAEESDKGYIVIESGKFNITAEYDAFQAETDLVVYDGTFNVKTGKGSEYGSTQTTSDHDKIFMDGNTNQSEESQKGFKAGRDLIIYGGNITADCYDDTIHSNVTAEINGGTLSLMSADDGIHATETININSGEISILNSYEGIEGTVINVNNGKINLRARDDGFNASEGSSTDTTTDMAESTGAVIQQTAMDGGMKGGFGDVSEKCELNINGGYVYVNADGDGLDSNGTVNINGGTTLVDGPTNDGNGALDTGTNININGGILIAAGSSGMAEVPSDTSKQASLAVSFDQSQDAESVVCIQDENGKSIITYSPTKTYTSVIISTPEIVSGKEYSIYYGGKCSGTKADGLYSDGDYSDGTLLEKVSVDSIVTQAGNGSLGMMGGGFGGGRDGHMRGEKPEMPTNENGEPDMEMPDGMTPPEGFNNDMPNPEGFDENMMPPNGFGGGHRGFHDEMPTNENGEPNMEMPEGFGGDMKPQRVNPDNN